MGRREPTAPGNTRALDRRDRQGGLPEHGLEQSLDRARIGEILLRTGFPESTQVVEVGARRKVLTGSCQQDSSDALRAKISTVDVGQPSDESRRQGIGAARIIELQPEQIVLASLFERRQTDLPSSTESATRRH